MGSIPSTLDILQNILRLNSYLYDTSRLRHFASKNKKTKQNIKPKQQTTQIQRPKSSKKPKPQNSPHLEKHSKTILTFKSNKR